MDILLVATSLIVTTFLIDGAFGRGKDDPAWVARWRALEPVVQARIAKAAESKAATEALVPEERDLMPGYRRNYRRRNSRTELIPAAIIASLTILAVAGVIGTGPAIYGGSLLVLGKTAQERLKKRRVACDLGAEVT